MPTRGFYFPSHYTDEQTNALRARLNALAASHGYTATRGPTTGQGVLAHYLIGLDCGEIASVMLADEQVSLALDHLDALVATDRWRYEWAHDIAAALRAAMGRKRAGEERNREEWAG